MKVYFSTIQIGLPDGERHMWRESGHPDKADVLELFARSSRYRNAAALEDGTPVSVCHYIYEGDEPGDSVLAEESHFSLMDTYNELADKYRDHKFEHRKDVCKVRMFKFVLH